MAELFSVNPSQGITRGFGSGVTLMVVVVVVVGDEERVMVVL